MSKVKHIIVTGDARQRGLHYGEQLRFDIHVTYQFYADKVFKQLGLSNDVLISKAARIKQLIFDFNPDYITELDAVAVASGMLPWQLYVLNARTEILNAAINECTAIYFRESAVLGQNWDWYRELEDLMVLVTHDDGNGHRALIFSEPGMLGKIGFNNRGIGNCLNFLTSTHDLTGVPVHIVCRAIIDADNIEQAQQVIKKSGHGKASHFLVGDDSGNCYSIEFAADKSYELDPEDGAMLHTNHYLAEGVDNVDTNAATTYERFAQGGRWLAKIPDQGIASMKSILLDASDGLDSINVSYRPSQTLPDLEIGTCATVIMDLKKRVMHLKKGPGAAGRFHTVKLNAV